MSDSVLVLETRSAAELAVAKSILDDAEIPYLERGDALQDLSNLDRVLFGMPAQKGHLTLHVPPGTRRNGTGAVAESQQLSGAMKHLSARFYNWAT